MRLKGFLMTRMTLEEVEKELWDYYQFFSQVAPGVTPVETGRLAELWGMFEEYVDEDGNPR